MWVLILTFLATPGIPEHFSVIDTYRTQESCESTREVVAEGMEKAYPGDKTYTITCQLKVNHT